MCFKRCFFFDYKWFLMALRTRMSRYAVAATILIVVIFVARILEPSRDSSDAFIESGLFLDKDLHDRKL